MLQSVIRIVVTVSTSEGRIVVKRQLLLKFRGKHLPHTDTSWDRKGYDFKRCNPGITHFLENACATKRIEHNGED